MSKQCMHVRAGEPYPLLPPPGYLIAVGEDWLYYPMRLWRGADNAIQPLFMLETREDELGCARVRVVSATSYNEALYRCQREAGDEVCPGRGWLSDWAWMPSHPDRVVECLALLKELTGAPPLLWESDRGIRAACLQFRSSSGRACAGRAVWGPTLDEALQALCEATWSAFDDGNADPEMGHLDISGGGAPSAGSWTGELAVA